MKYEIIYSIKDYSISLMCEIAGVSKSGYYKWLKNRNTITFDDVVNNMLVEAVFYQNDQRFGVRRIKMELEKNGIIMNRKKIRRIMKENHLETKIRKQDPYKNKLDEEMEEKYFPNVLNRRFKYQEPLVAFGIDITYLKYNNRFAYLCVLIDVRTSEVISYALSDNLRLDFVMATVENAITILNVNGIQILIHSDQGIHFRAKSYCDLLKAHNIIQSMSAAGTPKDNGVIESFFGHMKDEINLKNVKSFEELKEVIDNYIYYYNNERKQWSKGKMTPIEYRQSLLDK